MEFNVGDRVVYIRGIYDKVLKTGDRGTICNFIDKSIGVDWDREFEYNGHDCDGYARMGHGRYVGSRDIAHTDGVLKIKEWLRYGGRNIKN